MSITSKQFPPSGYVVFKAIASNDGIKLNDATIGANSIGETVQSMTVSEVMWSGDWTIARGANNVATYGGAGHHDYQASGMPLEINDSERSANCNVTLNSGTGVIVVKMHKKSGE